MQKLLFFIFLSIFLTNCNNGNKQSEVENVSTTKNQVIVYEKFDDLQPLFENKNDTTYLVNFWATTCPPCLKEMPHFEELEKVYDSEKLRVILVSLDLKEHLEKRVLPYIEKHEIKPEVVLLADQNYSAWTEKIDTSWYGALPATLILKNEERKFFFGAFETFEDVNQEIEPLIH